MGCLIMYTYMSIYLCVCAWVCLGITTISLDLHPKCPITTPLTPTPYIYTTPCIYIKQDAVKKGQTPTFIVYDLPNRCDVLFSFVLFGLCSCEYVNVWRDGWKNK